MDKNTYILLGAAAGILIKEGRDVEAAQLYDQVQKIQDDREALQIISQYIETENLVLSPEMQRKKLQLLDLIQKNKRQRKKQPER